ncbi:L-seryl-tRNA(Sec) selenium transferase [Chloroflexota bacterium]
MADNELRRLPSVDKIITDVRLKQLYNKYPHSLIVDIVRQRLEQERLLIIKGSVCSLLSEIVDDVILRVEALTQPSLRPVINASGVILHTNLGCAPMSGEAIAAMSLISKSYCNLEFDLESGSRGSRYIHVEKLLCQLTGAEAALVVNNNAAAVLLILTALAKRREVVVSRGEAVEIGGGFRIPDVMRQSGAKLIEVGTTNCTYISDYEQAINNRTAALLRVHPSNFRVEGYTHGVSLEDLIVLGNRHGIPVFDDLGSGCFLDTTLFGLAPEPMVQQSVMLGVGLACFSGDKLVGGPQAGIIVGQKLFIDKLKRHPLMRALRVDKIRLAALVATLTHYIKGEALKKVPVWSMMSMSLDEVEKRARYWVEGLGDMVTIIKGESMLGGGSLPGSVLPTMLVAISTKKSGNTAQLFSKKLRQHRPPIIGRISDNVFFLDPRSVLPEDDGIVFQALRDVITG